VTIIKRCYLLDTNIILTIWEQGLDILDIIEENSFVDFKITNDCVVESCPYTEDINEYFRNPKILQLLDHMISNDVSSGVEGIKLNRFIIKKDNKIYSIVGNKISPIDYSLIVMCQNYPYLTLVTDDKRILKSAQKIIPQIQYLNFKEFMVDLQRLEVITSSSI